MRVAILTREYPPAVYGGAGVHVEYLSRELAHHVEVAVHCFGAARTSPLVVRAHQPWDELTDLALATISVDLSIAQHVGDTDLVHSHTWYANLAGHLAKLRWGVPHVCTPTASNPSVRGRPSSSEAAMRCPRSASAPPSSPPTR